MIKLVIKKLIKQSNNKPTVKRDSDCDGSQTCDCDQCWDASQP